MSSLYDLTHDFMQVQALIEEGGEGLQDTLESIDLAIEDKLENIGKVIRNLETEVNSFKEEEKRLSDKRKVLENNVKRLKQYAENALITTGNKKLKAGTFTFAIQKNPPNVAINDEKLIPGRFYTVEPKLDKTTLKEVLNNGVDVPGAELVQGESLRIR